MSAYKKLKSQDAFVTTYVAKKNWYYSGSNVINLAPLGIQVLAAVSASASTYLKDDFDFGPAQSNITGQGTFKEGLTYKSIDQLYYRNYNNTNGASITPHYLSQAIAGNSITTSHTASLNLYDHYETTTQTPVEGVEASGSRYLKSYATIYSLPRDIIGTHIEPGSFKMIPAYNATVAGAQADYVATNYVEVGYIDEADIGDVGYLNGLEAIVDDGQGNLKLINSIQHTNIGNIIYSHGLVILTNPDVAFYFQGQPDLGILTWKSNQPIYTYNYHVKVSDYEFNHTLNPTALTGSNNRLRNNVSGSDFQPYITSVGLYNDVNELIAIAKLSQPLQKPADTELTIQVKLDI
jgi:hypothetical protein